MIRFVTACVLVMLIALPVHAQQASSRFLVIDAERLATEPNALRDLYQQVEDAMLRQAVGHNQALDALEAEFAPIREARETMDPAQYQEALDGFNTAAAQLEAALVEAETGINAAAEKALAKFNARRTQIEQAVLQDNGAIQFIDASSVLYARPGLNLDKTDEMIATLNRTMPSLPLEQP